MLKINIIVLMYNEHQPVIAIKAIFSHEMFGFNNNMITPQAMVMLGAGWW